MAASPDDLGDRHRRARVGFGKVVDAVDPDRWTAPSPCTDWDARGVLEHVIGFHEVLLLRPLGVKAERPRDDPVARWHATDAAISEALDGDGALDTEVEVPGGSTSTVRSLIQALTSDVLVHGWDLARATGVEPALDPDLCASAYELARENADRFQGSGMFGPPVAIPDNAPVCDRLLGVMGRDPAWTPDTG